MKGKNAYIGVALLYTRHAHSVQYNWKAQSRCINQNRALSPTGLGAPIYVQPLCVAGWVRLILVPFFLSLFKGGPNFLQRHVGSWPLSFCDMCTLFGATVTGHRAKGTQGYCHTFSSLNNLLPLIDFPQIFNTIL
jgi:hypothetical protein